MKRIFSIILIMVLMTSSFAFADTSNTDTTAEEFSLIQYVNNNNINSVAQLESVIIKNTNNEQVLKSLSDKEMSFNSLRTTNKLNLINIEEDTQVNITINEENGTIGVTEITNELYDKTYSTRAVIYSKNVKATHREYSDAGMKIYTVTAEGKFSYDKSTYCDISREKGFFTEAFLSLWDASVWINGDTEGSTAFVNTYGTATMRLSIAKLFGINPIIQAQEYSLMLECDKYGNTSATWDLN